ncbi:protein of unknown function [Pseudogulbenkiania sp. NH8B]|uniref:gp16 family protein n=1 Tax=Pseudogulbenkiania sp. (strain NH8B) TaxID=748280 RepID=UPI0002279B41|nr:regulatory protein GemA [Pseudogulbenkiania sp. NH8B]BAK76470.1 protein of unknown function [Pseudogulbenkiania sp. NH8B]BAK76899.1 protein of unknown function [Pseudogulbenkiania sp. NH8B]
MTDRRRAMIGKLHVARQQIGMAEEDYRAMLARVGEGKTSSTTLTLPQLDRALAEMKRLGFVPKPPQKAGKRPTPTDERERYMAKVEALLADAGRPWEYADATAKRMYQIDKVAWLDLAQLRSLMVALEIEARRHGRGTEPWEK